MTFTFDINYLIFWVLLKRYGPRILQKSYKVTNSMVIGRLSIQSRNMMVLDSVQYGY